MSYRARDARNTTVNMKNLFSIVIRLVVVVLAINSTNLLYKLDYSVNENMTTTSMTPECTANPIVDWIRDVVHVLSRSVLPMIFQIVLSAKLLKKLYKLSHTNTTTTIDTSREKRYSIVILLNMFILILSEVILISSTVINYLYNNNSDDYIQNSSNQAAISAFAFLCSSMVVWFLIFDLSFFLNVLTNKKFRDETKKLFRLK
jgi:hypothetical protein